LSRINGEELKNQGEQLAEYYVTCFQHRYAGNKPVLQPIDHEVFRFLGMHVGFEKAQRLISLYLKQKGKDGIYEHRGHPTKFLRQDVNQLLASLGGKERSNWGGQERIRILLSTGCAREACKTRVFVPCYADEAPYKIFSETCLECQAQDDMAKRGL
jgi:hypothetical protein